VCRSGHGATGAGLAVAVLIAGCPAAAPEAHADLVLASIADLENTLGRKSP
jgi:hypothetical protein